VQKLTSTPEKRLIRRFYAILAKKYPDVSLSPATGLMEIAECTGDPNVREFAEIYYGNVYRDRRPSASQIARLRELVSAMKKPSGKDPEGGVTRHNSLT